MVLFTTESPGLVDACTVALLSTSPDVKHLRDRIGAQIHRRLFAALGSDADPRVVRVLETTFAGALLTAGMGHMSSLDIPEFVAGAADLMVASAPVKAKAGGPAAARSAATRSSAVKNRAGRR